MKKDYDSVYFYKIDNPNYIKKEVFGVEKELTDNFL
jgi:hypothetical protein